MPVRLIQPGVYCITNLVNGKRYVGSSTKCIYERMKQHRRELRAGKHFNRHLQKAWKYYGETAFKFSILAKCTPETAVVTEQKFINWFKAADFRFGYNARKRAESNKGWNQSKATKARIAANMKGKIRSPEHCLNLAKSLTGKVRSLESRRRQAASRRGMKLSAEHRSKIGAAHKGRKFSKQARELLKKNHWSRKPGYEETRAKLSKAAKRAANIEGLQAARTKYWERNRAEVVA